MPEETQKIRMRIGKSKDSLTITLNRQLQQLGFKHGDTAEVEWGGRSLTVTRVDAR